MYKVVLTVEDGNYMFSDVPSSWESNGTLWWPNISQRTANADKVLNKLKYTQALPQSNWKRIKCSVKGVFPSYEDARAASKSYSAVS